MCECGCVGVWVCAVYDLFLCCFGVFQVRKLEEQSAVSLMNRG